MDDPIKSVVESLEKLSSVSSEVLRKRHNSRKKLSEKYKAKLPKISKYFSEYEIPGVVTLPLSKISQKVIDCVVGETVCVEFPWTYVKKGKILDNIDLHELSSEFLPVKAALDDYPKEKVLIGYNLESRTEDFFFIVLTTQAHDEILEIFKRKKQQQLEKAYLGIYRPVGVWQSFGSEQEINECSVTSLRSLYDVEIVVKLPMVRTPQFSLRNVKNARDGYVEILPDRRFTYDLIERKCVNAGVQAVIGVNTNFTQTVILEMLNKTTQYELNFEEKSLPPKLDSIISSFISSNLEKIEDDMLINRHINIHKDDYSIINLHKGSKTRITVGDFHKAEILASFININYWPQKYVNDISWDYFRSGIVAVCYSYINISIFDRSKTRNDLVYDKTFNNWPVMVWSYNDDIKAKLLLHSPKEVVRISYCPYKPNILVGGCTSGQIVVWDLSHRMEYADEVDILTERQERNKMTLKSLMVWMKNVHNKRIVEPVFIADIKTCHRAPVMSIVWSHPNFEYTSTGECITVDDYPRKKSCQFMTGSIDGKILIWDLTTVDKKRASVKRKRLLAHPELTKNITSFHLNTMQTNYSYKPINIIIIKSKKKPTTTSCLIRSGNIMSYKPVIPDPTNNPLINTPYKLSEQQIPHEKYPFIFATFTGQIFNYTWGEKNVLTNCKINTEIANVQQRLFVHDGPIKILMCNNFYKDIFLSVGGSTWAIWHVDTETPILWRKAKNKNGRYLSVMWRTDQPSYLMALRNDGYLEWWNFLSGATSPVKEMSIGGDRVIDMFGGLVPSHCRKSTYVITDKAGSFTVLHVPKKVVCTEDEKEEFKRKCQRFVDDVKKRKELLFKLEKEINNNVYKRVTEIKDLHKQKLTRRYSQIERMERIFKDVQWYQANTNIDFSELLQKKSLNISALMAQKKTLAKRYKDKKDRQIKLMECVSKAKINFETYKSRYLKELSTSTQPNDNLVRICSITETELLYIEDYKEIECMALTCIQKNQYRSTIDFPALLTKVRYVKSEVFDTLHPKHKRSFNKKEGSPTKTLSSSESLTINSKSFLEIQQSKHRIVSSGYQIGKKVSSFGTFRNIQYNLKPAVKASLSRFDSLSSSNQNLSSLLTSQSSSRQKSIN